MGTEQPEVRLCFHCNEPISEGDPHLVISSMDGSKQFVHSVCFTETTFDPDRFARIDVAESKR